MKRLSPEEFQKRERAKNYSQYYRERQQQNQLNQKFEDLPLEAGSLGIELDLKPETRFTTEEDGFLAFLMETETD